VARAGVPVNHHCPTRFFDATTPHPGQQAPSGVDPLGFMDALGIRLTVRVDYSRGGRPAALSLRQVRDLSSASDCNVQAEHAGTSIVSLDVV
jgi:hypothetical protein